VTLFGALGFSYFEAAAPHGPRQRHAPSIAQGVLGLVVLALSGPPREALHILYGFAVVLAMPLAASLVRDRAPRGQSVALGFAALFTAGLAIRGIITA